MKTRKYVWRFFECGLPVSKKYFLYCSSFNEDIYNEMKNVDGDGFWSDGVFDVFKDYAD